MAGRLSPTERIAARLVTTGMTAREADALLAAHDAQVKAEAWDEGASVRARSANAMTPMTATYRLNPYRATETEATR